jgi:hypothetical protein
MDREKTSRGWSGNRLLPIGRDSSRGPACCSIPEEPFDSIAVSYLLHCLPGPIRNKAILFENLAPLLSDTGVLFGSTILGAEVDHNRLGRQLMRIYNGKGVFDNEDDRFEDLKAILTRQFQNVRMEQQGVVALFRGCLKSPDSRQIVEYVVTPASGQLG